MLIAKPVMHCVLFFEGGMSMNAIIYTTNAGSTERYAKLLGHETGLPVYSLSEARGAVPNGADVIYLRPANDWQRG